MNNVRVQLEFPTLKERTMAAGALYDARIFDDPGHDWRQGDVVTILSLDGFSSWAQATKYSVDLVLSEAAPLAVTEVQLMGAQQ